MDTEKNRKILLVEDQALIALSKTQELKHQGYEVTHVLNGEKAVEIINNDPLNFDLILMDIDLGNGMDGTQTAEEILKEHDIPILFLSSHTEKIIVEKTEKITSYGYVVKNSGITVLDASIKMAFKLFAANKKLENQKFNLEISNKKVLEASKLNDLVISTVNEGIIVYGPDLKYQVWNKFVEDLTGVKAIDILGRYPLEIFPFMEETGVIDRLKRALTGDLSNTIETIFITEHGVSSIWAMDTVRPLRNTEGEIIGVIRIIQDISEKKRQEQLYILENEALDLYSIKKAAIKEVITHLLNGIRKIHPSMFCSVLKLHENKLFCWSSPHLPEGFNKAIEGIEIGVGQGACGTAAYLKKKVVVSDISTDPITSNYKELADKYELKVCWSHPIVNSENKVMATFAIYLKTSRNLTRAEELTIERVEIILKNIIQHRQAENKYRNSLERVSDAFISLDNNWCFTYMNKKAGEIFGRNPLDLIGKNIWDEFPNGINQAFYKAYYKAVETEQYIEIEAYYQPYDRWFVNHIYPSQDGLSIYFSDITERKKEEEKLKKSEERLNLILLGSNDPSWDMDLENNSWYFSPGWWNILGYQSKELLGDNTFWRKIVHPDDLASAISIFHDSLNSDKEIFQTEFRLLHKDGYYVPFLSRGFIKRNDAGKAVRISGTNFNLSHHKNSEEIIRKEQEFSAGLISSMRDGFALVDAMGVQTDVNESFCKMTGFSREELIGVSAPNYPYWPPEEFDNINKAFERSMQMDFENFELIFMRKNGERFPVIVSPAPLRDREGNIISFLATVKDITDRKKSEKEIQKLLDEKELLLKEVHHRTKNNINIIMSLLTIQAERLGDSVASEALNDARNRMKSMMVLYEKLYNSFHYKELEVDEFLSSLIDEIIKFFPGNLEIQTKKFLDKFTLDADRLLSIGIIINELITNSMKYAFIGKKDAKITISASLDNNLVKITVQDNGNGLPENIDLEKSSGLGLMLVKELSKQIDSEVSINRNKSPVSINPESEALGILNTNKGTEFILEFKLKN